MHLIGSSASRAGNYAQNHPRIEIGRCQVLPPVDTGPMAAIRDYAPMFLSQETTRVPVARQVGALELPSANFMAVYPATGAATSLFWPQFQLFSPRERGLP
jgi:hypothetical protein